MNNTNDFFCIGSIGDKPVQLKILSTSGEKELGYQFKEASPGEGEGLLFLFGDEEPRMFHMKNVKFDLDLLGFDSTGKLVCVVPMKSESKEKYFIPSCQYVVEMRRGWGDDLEQNNTWLKIRQVR